MAKLVSSPSLCNSKVSLAAVSEDASEIVSALEKRDIDVLKIKKNSKLSYEISSHADCNLCYLGNKTFVCDSTQIDNLTCKLNDAGEFYIVNNLTYDENSIKIICEEVKSPYPNDVKLNVKIIGNKILCNKKNVSETIINFSKVNNYEIINCNQGYAGCSTVVLNNHSIITDDKSISSSCKLNGLDVLLINKGDIILQGFDYGFIGGTCGFIEKNLLAFTGRLDTLVDSERIKKFLSQNSIEYVELTDGKMIDVGGIIPLIEK